MRRCLLSLFAVGGRCDCWRRFVWEVLSSLRLLLDYIITIIVTSFTRTTCYNTTCLFSGDWYHMNKVLLTRSMDMCMIVEQRVSRLECPIMCESCRQLRILGLVMTRYPTRVTSMSQMLYSVAACVLPSLYLIIRTVYAHKG